MSPPVPLPDDEPRRLERLRSARILDTLPSPAFDRITRLASRILGMPIALVSLVDEDRQWFKSKVGLDADETPREQAFCAHTICGAEVMIVPDATADPRFAVNPLVTSDPKIRFYAGAPLRTPDGFNLGTLCVIDRQRREFGDEERQLLEDLACLVVDEIELTDLAEKERQAQQRLSDAIEALSDGFVLYDQDDRLVICNDRYREIYAESADLLAPGASFEEMLRVGVSRGQYPDAVGREEEWVRERMRQHLNPGDPIEQRLPNGRWLRIEERKTSDGGLVGFRIDITELKQRQLELHRLASRDPLTGALNRREFMELGEAELSRTRRTARPLAVLLMDADHFKSINDTYGHAAGDEVLRAITESSQRVLRQEDLICRYGGEEFAMLLPETDVGGAGAVASRLREAVASLTVPTAGREIKLTVSIGGAVFEGGNPDLAGLLERADEALYAAKRRGRNRVVMAPAEAPDTAMPSGPAGMRRPARTPTLGAGG